MGQRTEQRYFVPTTSLLAGSTYLGVDLLHVIAGGDKRVRFAHHVGVHQRQNRCALRVRVRWDQPTAFFFVGEVADYATLPQEPQAKLVRDRLKVHAARIDLLLLLGLVVPHEGTAGVGPNDVVGDVSIGMALVGEVFPVAALFVTGL